MPVSPDAHGEELRQEWLLFAGDRTRQQEPLRAVAGRRVRRVLDVGCGAGQDLIPFASTGVECVGVDVSHDSGVLARTLFTVHYPRLSVSLATAAAEHLPFGPETFDVAICRVAIPYTNNRAAIGEMARVLRPGGVLLLKIHHLRYYLHKAADGVRQRWPRYSIHALRVMITGLIYHVTGRQPAGGLLIRETFLTEWLLRKELRAVGLSIQSELADSNPLTRSYRIVKAEAGRPRQGEVAPNLGRGVRE